MRAMSLLESPSQPRCLLPVLSLPSRLYLLVSRFLPVASFPSWRARAPRRMDGHVPGHGLIIHKLLPHSRRAAELAVLAHRPEVMLTTYYIMTWMKKRNNSYSYDRITDVVKSGFDILNFAF